MAVYEKRDDVYCGSCGHFIRHYIWYVPPCSPDAGRFMPLGVGHCVYPRMKDRREGQSSPGGPPAARGRAPGVPGRRAKTRRAGRLRSGASCYLRFSSFRSWAWNSSGRPHHSSTGSPVRGWRNRSPTAWRHWP